MDFADLAWIGVDLEIQPSECRRIGFIYLLHTARAATRESFAVELMHVHLPAVESKNRVHGFL